MLIIFWFVTFALAVTAPTVCQCQAPGAVSLPLGPGASGDGVQPSMSCPGRPSPAITGGPGWRSRCFLREYFPLNLVSTGSTWRRRRLLGENNVRGSFSSMAPGAKLHCPSLPLMPTPFSSTSSIHERFCWIRSSLQERFFTLRKPAAPKAAFFLAC